MRLLKQINRKLLAASQVGVLAISPMLASCGGSSGAESSTSTTAAASGNTGQPAVSPQPAVPPLEPTPPAVVPAKDGNGKLKIFILAGQSNMIGYGKVDLGADLSKASRTPHILGGAGSLRAMVNNNPAAYSYLLDPTKSVTYNIAANAATGASADTKTYSSWATRSDVWVSSWDEGAIGKTTERRKGALSVGFGDENVLPAGYIGPEFGFGHIVGNGLTDKVLLVKTAWGGKSLAVDFRPPSSGGTTGPYYNEMLAKVRLVLSDVKKYYPDYDGKGFEVAGLAWHQGWNDRVNAKYVDEYEVNLANLIRDVRKDLNLPLLPVAIANTGMANVDSDPVAVRLITAQGNVADPKKYPEFAGNVATVDTRPFHYPQTSPEIGFIYHWNYNGESYFHIGESMGMAMLKLIKP
jgi:Carbohydrate esterase, sialic acid-specific acetylesterase